MRKLAGLLLALPFCFGMQLSNAWADLQPLLGLSLFGGAERGTEGNAGGIGGVEGFGLLPLSQQWGLQASMRHEGGNAGNGGYRFGLSAGPVYGYGSGKIGLNVDYEFVDATNSNFIYLRGVWAHYFETFDFVLSYSQPVHEIQLGEPNLIRTRLPPT